MSKREVRLHCRLRKPRISTPELVDFALDVLGRLDLEGEVGIRICSSRSMSALNRRFRGKVGPTDVLSFRDGTPQPGGEVYLGDIVIAAPVAATAAKEEGVPFEVELKRLLLHGILHLAGYDHEADSGAMRRKERDLRRGWGIA